MKIKNMIKKISSVVQVLEVDLAVLAATKSDSNPIHVFEKKNWQGKEEERKRKKRKKLQEDVLFLKCQNTFFNFENFTGTSYSEFLIVPDKTP